ncbi:hypothetical protein Clacol_000590 [Clathrus columnatus]|uniref:DNA polymerase kappa n=1 Tax=Clathrus columnatus TaxID=1419009 RepID=A0AAV5A103_9AGAM|nr:hypothetical protein Clacol_000590 [Clathrus columnatus]
MEESLVKRLAGPSTGKAGLAKDQTEINRIIAQASKGSKFFENERRKDQELTQRIHKLIKHRDELLKGIDVGTLSHSASVLICKLSQSQILNLETSQRDLSQYIVHADMDAFFAAVELLDNPKLKGHPFGVGKGVLTTASYDARQYGVRSGMPVMGILRQYDPEMLAAGADEAFLNITNYCKEHSMSPEECVQKLQTHVHAATSLTVSAGIAPNKMLAKICSDKNKPNGQFQLLFNRDAILSFMRDLPIRKIPGIGRVTERLLDAIGIKTCGDIYSQRAVLFLLDKQFHSESLFLTYLGIASNVVQPMHRNERKSVGSERTFDPINDPGLILQRLEQCAQDLEGDLEDKGWAGQTVTLKYKLDTYQAIVILRLTVFTRAKSLTRFVSTKKELLTIGKSLLLTELPLCIRLIGLRVTKLKDLRAPENQGVKRLMASPSKKPPQDVVQKEETDVDLEEERAMAEYEDEIDQEAIMASQAAADEAENDDVDSTSPLTSNPITAFSKRKLVEPLTHDNPSSAQKPTSVTRQVVDRTEPETFTCPICDKSLAVDNDSLNQHVDFCLSKDAIMAATIMSNESSKRRKL